MINSFLAVLAQARENRKEEKPVRKPYRRRRIVIRSERYDLTQGQVAMHQAWAQLTQSGLVDLKS